MLPLFSRALPLLFSLALLLPPLPARAAENRYEVLSRLLMPFVSVFAEKAKTPNRALVLTVRLEEMTGLPPALAGVRAELAIEAPDKLRLHAPVLGETLTLCRRGQELWVHPGSRAQALLDRPETARQLPPLNPKATIAPFRLPIPEKQLVFLPALFQVRDAGEESLDGQPCRVLDLQLMSQLARSLEAGGWSARVWVQSGDSRPARLVLTREGIRASLRFEKVEFQRALPAATWEPTVEEAGDVLQISAARYDQLFRAAFGEQR